MPFVLSLTVGTVLIVLCVFLQGYGLRFIDRVYRYMMVHENPVLHMFRINKYRVDIVVLAILAIHTVQVWGWAVFYYGVGLLPSFETALYFSATTFSTLGYGDILLPEGWRLTATLEAVSGLLLLGWSTAFIFSTLRHFTNDGAA